MSRRAKIIFITGTDTGVGKTLLTALLLHHLRSSGRRALAMKPFCSGGRGDVELLQALQPGELPDAEANPFYFHDAVAPAVARETRRRKITLSEVVDRIEAVRKKCDTLLIEGSGGLLVPLGKGFMVADLIARLDCDVVVVGRNRLGTINHTLLTVKTLNTMGRTPIAVAVMCGAAGDLSSRSNTGLLGELLKPVPVREFPYLGALANRAVVVKECAPRLKKLLQQIAKRRAVR